MIKSKTSFMSSLREGLVQQNLPGFQNLEPGKRGQLRIVKPKFPETDEEARAQGYKSLEDFQQSQHLDSIMNESLGPRVVEYVGYDLSAVVKDALKSQADKIFDRTQWSDDALECYTESGKIHVLNFSICIGASGWQDSGDYEEYNALEVQCGDRTEVYNTENGTKGIIEDFVKKFNLNESAFSQTELREMADEHFEVGDLVIAKKWPEKGVGKVIWTDGRNVHVRYADKGRTVNYAPNSLDHVKIEVKESAKYGGAENFAKRLRESGNRKTMTGQIRESLHEFHPVSPDQKEKIDKAILANFENWLEKRHDYFPDVKTIEVLSWELIDQLTTPEDAIEDPELCTDKLKVKFISNSGKSVEAWIENDAGEFRWGDALGELYRDLKESMNEAFDLSKVVDLYDFVTLTADCKTEKQLRDRLNAVEDSLFKKVEDVEKKLGGAVNGDALDELKQEYERANAEAQRWGEAAVDFEETWKAASGDKSKLKNPERKGSSEIFSYQFCAPGYGCDTYKFPAEKACIDAVKADAESVAEEHGGKVRWWDGKECVVEGPDGKEIARYTLMFEPTGKEVSVKESTQEVPQNPDDSKADDLFIHADEYEEQLKALQDLKEGVSEEKTQVAKNLVLNFADWAKDPNESKYSLELQLQACVQQLSREGINQGDIADEIGKAQAAIHSMEDK